MRIIAKSRLMALAAAHVDCIDQVAAWYAIASKASWRTVTDVRRTCPHADLAGDKTVFNIKGNHSRLIVYMRYDLGIIYVKDLLTHADYDKGAWKARGHTAEPGGLGDDNDSGQGN